MAQKPPSGPGPLHSRDF